MRKAELEKKKKKDANWWTMLKKIPVLHSQFYIRALLDVIRQRSELHPAT